MTVSRFSDYVTGLSSICRRLAPDCQAQYVPVCVFLVFGQIVTESYVLFHHSIYDYECFSVMIHW